MIKNILVGMMLGITLVGSVAAEDAPTTLSNSGTISPYKPERGGIFLAPDLLLVIPGNTKLDISTQPWVDSSNNTIVISKMPYVSGTKYAKDYAKEGSVFTYTTDERYRYFKGNGLPSTPMGEYPVQKGTEAYKYYSVAPGGHDFRTGIPGSDYSSAAAIGISPYNLTVQLPKYPKPSATPNPIASLPIGVTLTGTVWHFELANASGTAWYNPTSLLPIDQCWGHPYAQQYHLHGYSWKCFPNQGTEGHSPLFGYAFDGFGIYGPRGDDGKMVTNAQLDECHGHSHPVMWDGAMQDIYHYHLNNEYPYSIGCFKGPVDYAKALGSPDLKAHTKPHGAPSKTHDHKDHGTPDIITIPRGTFQ
jgi:YHYH protein